MQRSRSILARRALIAASGLSFACSNADESALAMVTITVRSIDVTFADLDGDLEVSGDEKSEVRPMAAVATGPAQGTDDHEGRLYLNRIAYYYLVPVVDIGLAIEPE